MSLKLDVTSIIAIIAMIGIGFTIASAEENFQKFHLPTWWELKADTLLSHISGKAYDNKTYVCTEFSNDLIAFFRDKGIFSCLVSINFDEGSHAIVAVKANDENIYFVEPQTAKIINSKYLGVGDDYCKKMNLFCSYDSKIIKISSCYGLKL